MWGWRGSVKNDQNPPGSGICYVNTPSVWMPLSQEVDAKGKTKDWKRKRSLRKRRRALKRRNINKMCSLKNLTRKRKLLLMSMKRGNKRYGKKRTLAIKINNQCKLRKRRGKGIKNGSPDTYKRKMRRMSMPRV